MYCKCHFQVVVLCCLVSWCVLEEHATSIFSIERLIPSCNNTIRTFGHTTHSLGEWRMDRGFEKCHFSFGFSCFLFHHSCFSWFCFIPLSTSVPLIGYSPLHPSLMLTNITSVWVLCCVTTLKTISLHCEPWAMSKPEDHVTPVWTLCHVSIWRPYRFIVNPVPRLNLKTISLHCEPWATSQPEDHITSLWTLSHVSTWRPYHFIMNPEPCLNLKTMSLQCEPCAVSHPADNVIPVWTLYCVTTLKTISKGPRCGNLKTHEHLFVLFQSVTETTNIIGEHREILACSWCRESLDASCYWASFA
jgi:hypothetical protein